MIQVMRDYPLISRFMFTQKSKELVPLTFIVTLLFALTLYRNLAIAHK